MKDLLRLFLIFLKIGATAFGGNIALVAVVRKELCQRRKLLPDEKLLDMITIGNILPGPLATNVVMACGYLIAGVAGAIVSLVALLIPSFLLICGIAEFYLRYGELPVVAKIFSGLLPGVAAIIASTAWSLAKKHVTSAPQIVLLVLATAGILLLHGFFATLLIVIVSGIAGYFFFYRKNKSAMAPAQEQAAEHSAYGPLIMLGVTAVAGLALFLFHPGSPLLQDMRRLGLTFGGMSVTLFGGGYVFIPAIENSVVHVHHWLSSTQFSNAIAVSQITPGPVSISAAFVGWKVAGLRGALIATAGIFFPPAILMVVAQQFVAKIKGSPPVEAVFLGVRPAVIGMIAASVWVIGKGAPMDWQSAAIFVLVLGITLWREVDGALLMLLAGMLGWLLHLG